MDQGESTAASAAQLSQRDLWRDARWRRWVVAAGFARLCGTMAPFALLLAGEEATGSFASGAWMTSAHALGAAVAAPWRGRALDGRALPQGLGAPLLALALLAGALALASALGAPLPLLLALSLLLGVIPAGVPGAYRALLPAFLPPGGLQAAFALDAVLLEVQWIGGPMLVGGLALVHPALSLGVIAVSALVGVAVSRGLPGRAPPPRRSHEGGLASFAPFVRGLPAQVYACVVAVGVSWGAVDAAVPARLPGLGARAELWGALAALLSGASAVGGLVYAGLARPAGPGAALRRALVLLALWGGLLLPLAVSHSVWALALWLAAAGLFLAPQVGLLTYLLQQTLPEGRQTEGFALYSAGWGLGIGVGSGLAALLLARGQMQQALAAGALVPLALALLLLALGRLRPGKVR